MKFQFPIFIAGLVCTTLFATQGMACVTAPTDYLVFSRGDILYSQSDFQGITGAGGNIQLSGFQVRNPVSEKQCPSLISAQSVQISDASVENGGIHAGGSIALSRVRVEGDLRAYGKVTTSETSYISKKTSGTELVAVSGVSTAADFFIKSSALFASWPATNTVEQVNTIGHVRYTGKSGAYTVYHQTNDEFSKGRLISLSGPADSYIVINISGAAGTITFQDLKLEGGIGLGHVIINFYQATLLTIQKSGDISYGIPASILAPYAATTFVDGLISGGLYVGSLCGNGQVNPGKFLAWQPIPVATPPPLACVSPLKCQ